jgi:uncharacterized protein (UPF0147 family)
VALSPEIKQPTRRVQYSSPYSAEFKIEEITSPLPHGVHEDKYLAFNFRYQTSTAIQNITENKAQEKVRALSSLSAFIFNAILRPERLISSYDTCILVVIYTKQIHVTAVEFCVAVRDIYPLVYFVCRSYIRVTDCGNNSDILKFIITLFTPK